VFCAAGISCLFNNICGSTYKINFTSCAHLAGRRFVIATFHSPSSGVHFEHIRARDANGLVTCFLNQPLCPGIRFASSGLRWLQRNTNTKKLHNTCGAISAIFRRYLSKKACFAPQVFLTLFNIYTSPTRPLRRKLRTALVPTSIRPDGCVAYVPYAGAPIQCGTPYESLRILRLLRLRLILLDPDFTSFSSGLR
jgi:hypothetical protein